jgi:hypothetical protein
MFAAKQIQTKYKGSGNTMSDSSYRTSQWINNLAISEKWLFS